MKFHLPSIKQILIIIGTICVCIIVGLLLLTASYMVFPDEPVLLHAKESAKIFRIEGPYPELDERYTSMLDNFTDSIMIKTAAYDGPESAFQKALISPRWTLTDKEYEWPTEEFASYYSKDNPEPRIASSYARYWNGYVISLRPALVFNNYGQIRALNLYIQLILSLAIIVLMIIRKCWQAIPAYAISVLHIGIDATAYSLQHSTVFYVSAAACIILLLFNTQMKKSNSRYIFFTIVGAATAYLDFLTYPLASFGMPAVVYLLLNREDKNLIDIRCVLNLLICWVAGYLGMWAGKWILASIFTNQNVIADAVNAVRLRTSDFASGRTITYGEVLHRNINAFEYPYMGGIAIAFAIIELIILLVFKNKMNWKMVVSCLLIAVLPFGWFMLAKNHCYVHSRFTNKVLMSTVFAILSALACWNPQRFIKTRTKENSTKTQKEKKSKK